ncbi:Putative AC transposase [Linum grandiflorum]
MSDVPPRVQGPQPPVEPAIVNGNDGGEGVVDQPLVANVDGEAAPQPPPNAPLVIDEEVIDRAKLKSLVWKHFKKIKVNNVWKAKSAIIMHEYPLSMVDHLYFKRFVCSLQPMFSVPSRNTMKKEIFGVYEIERTKIQRVIDKNSGRIAITTDMWTASNQKKGYMAVTSHFIDNLWTLRSHMLR